MTEPRDGTEDLEAPGEHLDEGWMLDLMHGLVAAGERRRAVRHMRCCADCELLFRRRSAEFEDLRARAGEAAIDGAGARPVAAGQPADAGVSSSGAGAGLAVLTPAARVPRRGPRSLRRVAAVPLGLAAAAALVLVLTNHRGSAPITAPEYWIPAGREITGLRSAVSGSLPELRTAIEFYDRHDWEGAVEHLRNADVLGGYDDLRRVYLAGALNATGRYREAIEVLDELEIDTMPPPWRDEARWFLCAALAGTGDRAGAAAQLDQLTAVPGEIGALARALQQQLGGR